VGRPPRDREAEKAKAEAAIEAFVAKGLHRVRKLYGPEADLLHRTFSNAPETYDAWEYETH
jgi:hypothetical protein